MPPRRSGRTSAGTPSALEETSAESTMQGSKRPPKKQQKKHNADSPETSKRGRGGKLRKLTEMPLDILFEIFGELNPLDVLNLARSSKALRNILLRRSAVSIWKKALSNVSGLPACPVYLSEPQYTNLAFDRHCHSCLATTQDVYWEYNIRCCSNCFNKLFSRNPLSNKSISSRPLVDLVYGLLPALPTNRRGYLVDYVRPNKEARCLLDRLEEVRNDDTGLNHFIEEQRSHFQQVKAHAKLCDKWQSEVVRQRAFELDEMRKRRKEAIIAKLRDLGWGEEIENERGSYRRSRTLLINHPLVRQPKELTERIWNNIKPTLVELMTNKRDARLKAEWGTRVSARIRMAISVVDAFVRPRYKDQWFPESVDFCLIDEFRALILDPSTDDSTITEASFKNIESCIPDAAGRLRLSQSRSLLELLPEGMNGIAEDATSQTDDALARLELATTFFSCRKCLGRDIVPQSKNKSAKKKESHPYPITYSRILTHNCLNNPSPVDDEDPNIEILSRLSIQKQPWHLHGDRVKFHRAASIIAHNVVTACGKDPAVTTASEMDEQDFRVECRRCAKGGNSRLVMTWTMAICHSIKCHSEKKGGSRSWILLDDDDSQKVKELEAAQLEDGKYQLFRDFRCTWCGKLQSKAGFSDHLRYSHAIVRPAEEGDFSKHRDVPIYRPPFAVCLNTEDANTGADD